MITIFCLTVTIGLKKYLYALDSASNPKSAGKVNLFKFTDIFLIFSISQYYLHQSHYLLHGGTLYSVNFSIRKLQFVCNQNENDLV